MALSYVDLAPVTKTGRCKLLTFNKSLRPEHKGLVRSPDRLIDNRPGTRKMYVKGMSVGGVNSRS